MKLLDKIIDTIGELVLKRNQLLQYSNNNGEPRLQGLSQELNLITSELQSDIMLTRMQPVGNVINKFDRLVRDFCRESGKKIQLKILGKETELDKTLLETIKDPLTHLIRNALDHGIEHPDQRIAAGKPEQGEVSIKSYHESGQVVIEISDDGKGLAREKIMQKALEKDLVDPQDAENLSDEEVFNLIFLPGFSTAQSVTKVSGRGVGMDVVKTNIENIGGSVSMTSKENVGTSFKLKIPLTLAIIPALTVESLNETFAIPQTHIEEIVLLEQSESLRIEKIMDHEFIRLRDELIPIFYLRIIINLEQVRQKRRVMNDELETQTQGQHNSQYVLILNAEGKRFGIVVDRIIDTEEIVVKPLSRVIASAHYFAGSTIMGDGSVALIVDAIGFYNNVKDERSRDIAAQSRSEVSVESIDYEVHEKLIVKLSDGQSYSVPLSLIKRLERITKSRVEKVGEAFIVKYEDKPMMIMDLAKKLDLSQNSIFEQDVENFITLVFETHGKVYGLVVSEIVDISQTSDVVDSHVVDRPGFLGTLYIDGKIITMLDIHSIVDNSTSIHEKNQPQVSSHILRGKKLLLLEDSPVYRKMEGDLFRSLGFEVLTAVNGKEGLDLAIKNKSSLDIIVTDIEMPEMNGFEFCQQLRAHEGLKEIPVVAISTKVTKADLEKGKEVGFNQHLEKFKRDQVEAALRQYFEEGAF